MLKSKKGLYILLPFVIFVWGTIIFQILSTFSNEDSVAMNTPYISFTGIKTKEREKFNINTINRDPFLGTIYTPKKIIVKKPRPAIKKEIIWPTITYKGLVSGNNNITTIFLIEINGIDQLMKVGDIIAGNKLIKGSTEAIKLRYKGKIKQFQILN